MLMFPKTPPTRLKDKELGELRHRVYERAEGRCERCRRWIREDRGEWDSMHLAHDKGRGANGGDTEENTEALCMNCHLVGDHNPKSVPRK